jgi:hypothetical protein
MEGVESVEGMEGRYIRIKYQKAKRFCGLHTLASPHSMAHFRAWPSAFMIALYAVMICPTNERALSLGIAFLSGANGPRPGGGLHDEKQQRRLGLLTC